MFLALGPSVRLSSRTAGRACVRVVCSYDWRGAWPLAAGSRRRCTSASLRLGRFARFSLMESNGHTLAILATRARCFMSRKSSRSFVLFMSLVHCLIVACTHITFSLYADFFTFLPLTWLVRRRQRRYIGRRRKYELDDALRVAYRWAVVDTRHGARPLCVPSAA